MARTVYRPSLPRVASRLIDYEQSPATRPDACSVAAPATRIWLLLQAPAGAESGSQGTCSDTAAREEDGRRIVDVGGQRVSPAVAEMVGWRRERTASMISLGSIPCR
jgi:hypothetical protein